MDSSIEAGPSRLSPPRNTAPGLVAEPVSSFDDIVMESASTATPDPPGGGGEPDEAVQLLLNISSSTVDVQSALPPKPEVMEILVDESHFAQKPGPPDTQGYPYTPPDDSNDHEASTSLSNLLTSAPPDTSIAHPLTPSHTGEPPAKPKQKRKRNATSGSSRRTSADRPPHWLGEDNTIIRCICGFTEDDGFTIQCEGCGAWEHGMCFGYVDESSAPDTFFCELCRPRPFDAERARKIQIMVQDENKKMRARAQGEKEGTAEKEKEKEKGEAKEKPRSKGGKAKRARTESVMEGELDNRDAGKEQSPGVMGPPAVKPRRRQQGGKPRGKQPTVESTPGPSSFREQTILEEPEDDYFRVEPWALEYTPIKDNIVRGQAARQIMRNVYREWVDAEDEAAAERSPAVHNPSGLPSPTETGVLRLSPDSLFPSPDFNTLAPPVPPVFLLGADLELLATPVSIQIVEDAPSFLPLTYAENISKHGVYTRPNVYSVFAEEPIEMGSFVGEYRGEITDCETYRRDPINQYSSLGTPKPHVRSIGPPINLMIDARGYGNDLRFVRSGCHPNVVLRPLFWRSSEGDSPKLKFGLFASKDIGKKDELILGWEWDDQHVVHSFRSVIHAAMLPDGSLASPTFSISEKKVATLARKIDSVLTHLFGTFTACACVVPGACALAQMGQIVEPKAMQGVREDGRKKQRVDMGDLVGAVRGWRRREIEAAEAEKWKSAEGFELGLTGLSSLSSETQTEEQEESEHPVEIDEDNRSEPEAEVPLDADVSMEEDPMEEEAESREIVENSNVAQSPQPLVLWPGTDEKMEVEEEMEDERPLDEAEEKVETPQPSSPDQPQQTHETPVGEGGPVSGFSSASQISLKQDFFATDDTHKPNPPSPSPDLRRSSAGTVSRMSSSSSLSSVGTSARPSLADGLESGSDSDATTATIPKSQFSGSDAESASESDANSAIQSPSKARTGKATKKRGSVSASERSAKPKLRIVNHDRDMESEEDEEEVIVKSRGDRPKQVPRSSLPSHQKAKIASLSNKAGNKVEAKRSTTLHPHRRARAKRIVSSSASEDEDEDASVNHQPSSDRAVSPALSSKSVKIERLEAAERKPAEEPRAVVQDQVTAPMASAVETADAAVPDPEILPPSLNDQPVVHSESDTALPREPTPAPKEPTPPPKEPTPPPPEPPKKVSLSDYLKSHKIRKETQTPVTEVPPQIPSPTVQTTALAPVSIPSASVASAASAAIDEIPGFGNAQPQPVPAITTAVYSSPIKAEPETPSAPKLNLFEFLPSARPSATPTPAPAPAAALTPVATEANKSSSTPTPSSSYVPRSVSGGSNDYFPLQSTAAPANSTPQTLPPLRTPAVRSSYIPRQASASTPGVGLGTPSPAPAPAPEYGYQSSMYQKPAPPTPSAAGRVWNPDPPETSPPALPPPLPVREPPPHTGSGSGPGAGSSIAPAETGTPVVRAPPTGPKVPPTGPRGLGLSAGPLAPGLGMGPAAGGPRGEGRGGYGGRGFGRGWRGRGFRGGWRGN